MILCFKLLVNRWLVLPQYECAVACSDASSGRSSEASMFSPNGYCDERRKRNMQVLYFWFQRSCKHPIHQIYLQSCAAILQLQILKNQIKQKCTSTPVSSSASHDGTMKHAFKSNMSCVTFVTLSAQDNNTALDSYLLTVAVFIYLDI